jgi:hypothetical protein
MYSGRLIREAARFLGSRLYDEETGRFLGRAFVLPWRGRIVLIGYTGLMPLRPVVRCDFHLNYWKLTLGFTAPREPDFPRKQ